jgi:hypothetical protein
MNPHLRELVETATAGKLSEAESRQAIADARREVTADHHALLQDLNDVVAAEAALRRRGEPIEIYRGAEIYAIILGVTVMMGADTAGRARFKCTVKSETFIDCTRQGIRRMIDEALDGSPYSDRRRRRTPSLN